MFIINNYMKLTPKATISLVIKDIMIAKIVSLYIYSALLSCIILNNNYLKITILMNLRGQNIGK